MAYFDTKSGSLEEAIRQAVGGKINEKLDAVNPKAAKKKFDDRKDKDIDNDGDVDSSDKFLHKKRKAISKAINKENFIGTPENTNAKLDATPGQSSDEWNQQVELMQKKNTSMREALAKVWGFDEGKNPFEEDNAALQKKLDKLYGKKKGAKKEDKTMTGKPATKVSVNSDEKKD